MHHSLDISQAVVKADNEDKQDAIMLADADNQEDPDNEQLDMQQDDNQPEDNDAEELDYDATDGDDGTPQQDNNDSDQALSKLNLPAVNIICLFHSTRSILVQTMRTQKVLLCEY